MRGFDFCQSLCGVAFADAFSRYRDLVDFRPALDPMNDVAQHSPHDLGHARECEDIARLESRSLADGIGDQAGPVGDAGHASASGVELRVVIAFAQSLQRILALGDAQIKSRRDAVGGDVVMGRADTTGGENVGKTRAELRHGRRDRVGIIWQDSRLAHLHTERAKEFCDGGKIGVLRPPRQELVADKENADGYGMCICHGRGVPLVLSRRNRQLCLCQTAFCP